MAEGLRYAKKGKKVREINNSHMVCMEASIHFQGRYCILLYLMLLVILWAYLWLRNFSPALHLSRDRQGLVLNLWAKLLLLLLLPTAMLLLGSTGDEFALRLLVYVVARMCRGG